MPRSVPEWIGKTDDAMPGAAVRDRLTVQQGDRCAKCTRTFGPGARAHCDHIKPLADGGKNREANLQMLCNWCHVEKTAAENSERAGVRRRHIKHLLDGCKTNRGRRTGFRKAEPQHTATRPIRHHSEETSP